MKIYDEIYYMWWAVDHEGEVLASVHNNFNKEGALYITGNFKFTRTTTLVGWRQIPFG